MTHRNRILSTLAGAVLFAALATPAAAQRFIPGEEEGYPRVQYPDSSATLNDRCIVRLRKLSLRMPATYVNQLPIGFC